MATILDTFKNAETFDCYEGDDFPPRYGSWQKSTPHKQGTHALASQYLTYSDYSGTLVERSNVEEWREMFADSENIGWSLAHGGYCTVAVVVKLAWLAENEEAADFLIALADYPVANEDLLSHMEMEAQGVAWENWARSEYREECGESVEDLSDEELYDHFHEACEKTNSYWSNEQGDEMYIDIKRVAKGS